MIYIRLDMAETVTCPDCGDEVDPRGLSGHMETHDSAPQAVADGGTEAKDAGAVTVAKDDLDVPDEELDEALPAANVSEDAITFRSIQEIEVTDEEMKRELLDELKQFISGSNIRL